MVSYLELHRKFREILTVLRLLDTQIALLTSMLDSAKGQFEDSPGEAITVPE
jgi:hypothetical protein